VAGVVSDIRAALDRRVGVEEYLIWSTVIAVVMFVPLRGTFMIGYAIILLNSLILLVFDKLAIHRNHMLTILALAGLSMVGALLSDTPLKGPMSQLLGIGVLSVYFFSALTIFGLSLIGWMELYMRAAFAIAVLGFVRWPTEFVLHTGETRLTSIYSEPSYFVYVTLPAVGYCINRYVAERRYGWESLIFLLSYVLADSSLGFLGLMLIALLTYAPRFRGWQLVTGAVLMCLLVGGLYVASANVRTRADDMVVAIASQDLSHANATTFAFLSNLYVAGRSFLDHPLTGIGLGGYANAYDKYIGNITGITTIAGLVSGGDNSEIESLQLNRDDAASMWLRITAELGLPGIALLLGFLIVCARVRGAPYLIIRNSMLPYLIVRMTRMGHYFTVELYFFVGIYLLNYLNYLADCRRKNPRAS
jgi:O-antigen ligase